MAESFITEVRAQNRIAIPLVVCQVMKLKKGSKIRVVVEKLG